MSRDAELGRLRTYVERARAFTGWDLSWISVRLLDSGLPWDYEAMARRRVESARSALDLGTGGGELVSRLAAGTSARFVAAEEWVVNAPVAAKRLRPLGVGVVRCETGGRRLPFRERAFDLVLSRHEAIDPLEVDRILAPGGAVLTQQVTPDSWPELGRFFPRRTVFADHFREYAAAFRAADYEVVLQRHDYRVAFETLGDLVAMLIISPWDVPGLDIEQDGDALLILAAELGGPAGIVMTEGRYVLEGRKAAG